MGLRDGIVGLQGKSLLLSIFVHLLLALALCFALKSAVIKAPELDVIGLELSFSEESNDDALANAVAVPAVDSRDEPVEKVEELSEEVRSPEESLPPERPEPPQDSVEAEQPLPEPVVEPIVEPFVELDAPMPDEPEVLEAPPAVEEPPQVEPEVPSEVSTITESVIQEKAPDAAERTDEPVEPKVAENANEPVAAEDPEEVSAPQQARVDAPPSPKSTIRPNYPRAARRRGEQGDVVLELSVNSLGQVESVSVVQSTGYVDLDLAAIKAVRSARFAPAEQNGVAVAAKATLKLTFRLK